MQIINVNRSQFNIKLNNDMQSSVDFRSPKNLRESLFSNEGEWLDFVLNRLDINSNWPGFISSTDKIILKEDKNMYAQLMTSQPLLGIMNLMNKVEK